MKARERKNLLRILESLFEHRITDRKKELEKCQTALQNNRALSLEGFERNDRNPERDARVHYEETLKASLKTFETNLGLVQEARKKETSFDPCSRCGSLFSVLGIIEAQQRENVPFESLPCGRCKRGKKARDYYFSQQSNGAGH